MNVKQSGEFASFSDQKIASGVDVVEIARVKKILDKWGERFLKRCLTEIERRECRGRAQSIAARIAAKEAVVKALGTGFKGVDWIDVETRHLNTGKPVLYLYNSARKLALLQKWSSASVSLTHSAGVAIAVVTVSKGD